MAENDPILLERFSTRADAEAFAELVRRYVRLVYSTAWRILKNEDDAADVTQETFFELNHQAARISGSLGNWLHQVTMRKSVDLIRRSAHRRRREHAYARTQPEEVQTWQELSGYVDEALDNLDESTKCLLLEHFLAGKTTIEMAQEHGISQATVSRRIGDGLEQLRGTLRRQGLLVTAASLGTMLMGSTSQAVPARVLAELSKMAMVGTTGATAALGGKAAVGTHVGAVKAMLATATAVAVVSGIGYVHFSHRPEPPAQSSIATQLVRQPAQRSSGPSDPVSQVTTTDQSQPQADSSPVAESLETEPTRIEEPFLEPLEPLPSRDSVGGISVGDAFSGVPTADLTTPEAVVYSFLALIDRGATDQWDECLAEGYELPADSPYPRYLGQPTRLVEVREDGDTARVVWEATAHTAFSHKGEDRLPGEFVPLSSRLVRVDGLWKLLKLDE